MYKKRRCRQSILIPGQQLVSDLSVMQADSLAMQTLWGHKVRNSCVKPHAILPHVAPCERRFRLFRKTVKTIQDEKG